VIPWQVTWEQTFRKALAEGVTAEEARKRADAEYRGEVVPYDAIQMLESARHLIELSTAAFRSEGRLKHGESLHDHYNRCHILTNGVLRVLEDIEFATEEIQNELRFQRSKLSAARMKKATENQPEGEQS